MPDNRKYRENMCTYHLEVVISKAILTLHGSSRILQGGIATIASTAISLTSAVVEGRDNNTLHHAHHHVFLEFKQIFNYFYNHLNLVRPWASANS